MLKKIKKFYSRRSRAFKDSVVFSVLGVLTFIFMYISNIYDLFKDWIKDNLEWFYDELITVILIGAVGFFVFAVRRWQELRVEVRRRKGMENQLRKSNEELDLRVQQRTSKLSESNDSLTREIQERTQAEKELRRIREDLERLVQERTAELTNANELLRREIVERLKTEKKLGRSEEKWRSLAENAPDVIMTISQEGVIQFINRPFPRPEGRVEDVIGTKIYSFIDVDEHEQIAGHVKRVFKQGQTATFETRSIDTGNPGGWHSLRLGPIKLRDQVIAATLIATDITGQKRIEAALRASEEKYRNLFEESHDIVFICKTDGELIDFNSAAVALFESGSKKDLLGTSLRKFLARSTHWPRFQKNIEKNGHVKDYEMTFSSRKIGKKYVLITAAAVASANNEITHYRGIIRDVTERKRLEQLLLQAHKMEAIGTLAGGIAHDFNNILFAIIGFAKMTLEDMPEKSEFRPNILEIYHAGQHAQELVSQILTFGRRTEYERKPVAFKQIVHDALKLLRGSLPATIEIREFIEEDAGIIMADPTHIQQVMMNLCTNAYYAMREEEGILEIHLKSIEVDDVVAQQIPNLETRVYVRLSVIDNGQGMDGATLERIFDPFFTTKPVGEGTGMGLSVVHGIVKSHGGAVDVSSTPGKGTIFEVYLPRIDEAVNEPVANPAALPGGSEHILLVDDRKRIVQLTEQMLEHLGYRVTSTTSSTRALKIFRENPADIDLVLTDQTMPQLTGAELSVAILQIRPETPIILMTGFTERLTAETAKKMGIREFILKPFDIMEMALALRRALGKSVESKV